MITSVVNSGVQSWVTLAVAVAMTIHIHAVVVQNQGITSKKGNMDKKNESKCFLLHKIPILHTMMMAFYINS